MKKLISIVMILCLFGTSSALALNYSGTVKGEATFETMEEAQVNGPAFLSGYYSKEYIPAPCMAGYPQETTFVYRSADRYGVTAAVRENSAFIVFAEQVFADKDAALSYLKDLGVIELADKAKGSVLLVTPADHTAFTRADQAAYYQLQSAMYNNGSIREGDVSRTFADSPYYGTFSYLYVIAADNAASFVNNYIVSVPDFAGRITGLLLINGGMDHVRRVSTPVPAYLVNASDDVFSKYVAGNDAQAKFVDGGHTCYYNQTLPLQKVVLPRAEGLTAKEYLKDAYYYLFTKAMRIPVRTQAVYASGAYSGYNLDESPFSLCERNLVEGGKTADGLDVKLYYDAEKFSALKTEAGEYLDTWYEILPEEVLDNTAPAGTVPLWLADHGGGDDPFQFCNEIGLLKLAGDERFAIVAPAYQSLYSDSAVCGQSLVGAVHMMLEKYPALDPSRVYVTGYSMGGGTTVTSFMADITSFAAAVPMAGGTFRAEGEALDTLNKYGIPYMLFTSWYDPVAFIPKEGIPKPMVGDNMNAYLKANKIDRVIEAFDYDKYPISGFEADLYEEKLLQGEYVNKTWFFLNSEGAPMVGFNFTYDTIHALYPEYGYIAWDFVKHFSRNQTTGEIEYYPNR